eukprot:3938181-Rhodomonas_salina.9
MSLAPQPHAPAAQHALLLTHARGGACRRVLAYRRVQQWEWNRGWVAHVLPRAELEWGSALDDTALWARTETGFADVEWGSYLSGEKRELGREMTVREADVALACLTLCAQTAQAKKSSEEGEGAGDESSAREEAEEEGGGGNMRVDLLKVEEVDAQITELEAELGEDDAEGSLAETWALFHRFCADSASKPADAYASSSSRHPH